MRRGILTSAMLAYITASLPAMALSDRPARHDPPPPTPRRPTRRLQQDYAMQSEIAAHNEAVEQRKAEKKARKAARRDAGVLGKENDRG